MWLNWLQVYKELIYGKDWLVGMDNIQIIHLPDLQFVRYCEKKYKVNRGIYNTIDSWLYGKGLYNIEVRRKVIIQFLEYVSYAYKNSKVKFGAGGLSSCLSQFWTMHMRQMKAIP